MAIRDLRRKRPSFEALEQRETPTGGLAGGPLAELAAHHISAEKVVRHTARFTGSGTAVLASVVPTSAGVVAVGQVVGQGTVIGPFTGSLQATASAGFTTLSASATFRASDGSTLMLAIATNKSKGSYTIMGGTGTFLGATGSGKVSGSVSAATLSLSFSFQGKITTIRH